MLIVNKFCSRLLIINQLTIQTLTVDGFDTRLFKSNICAGSRRWTHFVTLVPLSNTARRWCKLLDQVGKLLFTERFTCGPYAERRSNKSLKTSSDTNRRPYTRRHKTSQTPSPLLSFQSHPCSITPINIWMTLSAVLRSCCILLPYVVLTGTCFIYFLSHNTQGLKTLNFSLFLCWMFYKIVVEAVKHQMSERQRMSVRCVNESCGNLFCD